MSSFTRWWYSLEYLGKVKTFLAWVVLVVLPAMALLLEARQHILENRRDEELGLQRVKDERREAEEKAVMMKERDFLKGEIARHEEQYGARRVTEEQKQKLLSATVSKSTGRISLAIVWSDQEAAAYGKQLVEAIQAAGFEVVSGGVWGWGSPPGLWLKVNNQTNVPAHAISLLDGLRSAGVQVRAEVDPGLAAEAVALYLGSKPLPAVK